ncbi:MAG: FG-GAP repeat domain-containing protein [Gemmataceae bacterium]
MIIADFNDDNRPDIVSVSSTPDGPDFLNLHMTNGQGQFGFGAAQQIIGNVHQTPVVEDIDGDGAEDIVIAAANGNLLFRKGRTDDPGTFDAPIVINPGTPSSGVAVLNGPGGEKILVSIDQGEDTLTLFTFKDGAFNTTDYLVGSHNASIPAEVQVAQIINAEGETEDIFVVRFIGISDAMGGSGLMAFRYNPVGNSYDPASFAPDGLGQPGEHFKFSITGFTLADLDNSGGLDLVVANQFASEAEVRLDGGEPRDAARYRAGTGEYHLIERGGISGADLTNAVIAADVVGPDGGPDGILDLITLNVGTSTIGILAGLGEGRFANPITMPMDGFGEALAAGDLDNDHYASTPDYTDLVVLTDSGLTNYLGTASGLVKQDITYNAGALPSGLQLADVDGDGNIDIVVGNVYGDVQVLFGKGNGTFQPHHAPNHIALAVADLNGDGRDDFVFSNATMDRVSVEFGTPGGATPQGISDPFLAPGAVQLSDLNGDNRPDLVIANSGNNEALVYLGKADGSFEPLINPLTGRPGFSAGTTPTGITIQDVNDDLVPDVIVANSGSNDVSILLGQGSGASFTLIDGLRVHSGGMGPSSTTVADVTGDGFVDIVVSNSQSNTVAVLAGLGQGFFNDQSPIIYAVGSNPQQALIGNFDGLAGLDLVSLNAGSNTLTFYANLGSGTAGLEFASGGLRPVAAFARDFNNDGTLDLVVANNLDGQIALFAGGANGLNLIDSIQSGLVPHPTALAFAGFSASTLSLYVSTEGVESAFFLQFAFQIDGSVLVNETSLQLGFGSFLVQAALAQATIGSDSSQVAELLPLQGDAASLLQVATLLTIPTPLSRDLELGSGVEFEAGDDDKTDEELDLALIESEIVTDQVIGVDEAFEQLRLEAQQDTDPGLALWLLFRQTTIYSLSVEVLDVVLSDSLDMFDVEENDSASAFAAANDPSEIGGAAPTAAATDATRPVESALTGENSENIVSTPPTIPIAEKKQRSWGLPALSLGLGALVLVWWMRLRSRRPGDTPQA